MSTGKEPEAMAQIHEIRGKLYKKTKNLTDRELLQNTRKSAEQLKVKFHLNTRMRSSTQSRR